MPRKPRLEYANAFYHVINRGRRREMIFHGDEYHQKFIDLLKDAHERFDCMIHCYCLMGNHYHLLIETPNANLSRIMRHIKTSDLTLFFSLQTNHIEISPAIQGFFCQTKLNQF